MKHFLVFWVSLTLIVRINGDDGTVWHQRARASLKQALGLKQNVNIAKNVIMFIGDGMGISTVSAARLYKAQLTRAREGSPTLRFEQFPHAALSKTYCTDRQAPDSSSTATAILCGVKTNYNTLGVNSNTKVGDCHSQKGNEVKSIAYWSKQQGKGVGIVTTTRVTHATPGANYAHSADRDWESDADLVGTTGACKDIARQLIEDNPDIDVVLGGGRQNFLSTAAGGKRLDGKNLTKVWLDNKKQRNLRGVYVKSSSELEAIDYSKTDYILGLFADSHMDFAVDRRDNKNSYDQPSLANMTRAAITVLKRNHEGFFLMVEGGRIDSAHHKNWAKRSLYETIDFDEAVGVAVDMVEEDDSLIIVTADHSHVFSMAGNARTGNDILGVSSPMSSSKTPKDGMPYLSLVYGNGPGGKMEPKSDGSGLQRRNFTGVDTHGNDFQVHAAVEMSSETHSAEDVGIFARGPMAHLFHGVQEQNYIAHVMAYASCVGEYEDNHCKRPEATIVGYCNTAACVGMSAILILICVCLNQVF